jgi:AcrR family transcriptional regulator
MRDCDDKERGVVMKKKDLRKEREQQRLAENRKFILEAAESIFASKGYRQTSVDDIAEETQFSKATLYRYFKSKSDIFSQVIQNSFQEARNELLKIKKKQRSTESKLKDVICYLLTYYRRKENIARIFFVEPSLMQKILKIDISDHVSPHGEKQSIPEDYMEIVLAMRQTITEILDEGIKAGDFRQVDPHEASTVFSSLIRGFHFQWTAIHIDYAVEESAELLLDYFLNGMRISSTQDKGDTV